MSDFFVTFSSVHILRSFVN